MMQWVENLLGGSWLSLAGWGLACFVAWTILRIEWSHWKRGKARSKAAPMSASPRKLPTIYRLNLAQVSDILGWALPLAIGFCLGFLVREVSYVPNVFAHNTAIVHELHNVRVVRNIGDYEYWLQTGNQPFFTRFCSNYTPQFSAGQTLLILRYQDFGNCWSVANTHPAYLIRREENGQPITN